VPEYTVYKVVPNKAVSSRWLWLAVWSAVIVVVFLVAVVAFDRSPWWALVAVPVLMAGMAIIAFGAVAARWTAVVAVVGVAAVVGASVGWAQKTMNQVYNNDPVMVNKVKPQLAPPLPGEPMNILVLGSDRRFQYGSSDGGRSDTLMLLRLDPKTKSISMLSVPRDLRVSIPGHGMDRINTAYSYGGADLSVKTFKEVTGLPINHFMDVNFVGFVTIVDALGGVYLDVDRRYYGDTDVTGHMSIDLKAGYQKLNGHDALTFVRFRSDATGDFRRMVRQQVFIRELKLQSLRWGNWKRIPKIVTIVAKNTLSDLSSMKQLLPFARLLLEVDTSRIYQTHIVASGIMVGGASELEASPEQIQTAVEQFTHPDKAAIKPPEGEKQNKKSFVVYVSNGGAAAGTAGKVVDQLKDEGYTAVVAGDVAPGTYTGTRIYATRSFTGNAQGIAKLMSPAKVVPVARGRGVVRGVSIVVGPDFSGQLTVKPATSSGGYSQQVQTGQRVDVTQWKQIAARTSIPVEMPTNWASGIAYDWEDSRTYTIPTGKGDARALCVVGSYGDPSMGDYWHIQEMRWTDPPVISAPSEITTIGGTEYKLFNAGAKLHMVAWERNNTLYWLSNTLEDTLSREVMLSLATSFKPVK
jgi:LCP family protein required for cell wall assembly